MNTGIFIIAHAPLANALRQCVLHVFPEAASSVVVYDVQPNTSADETLAGARAMMAMLGKPQVLVLTDLFGATPCNVAQKIVDGSHSRLIAGVNVPMLLRAVTYRNEPLDVLVTRTLEGGAQGVMQVSVTALPSHMNHDQNHHDHQQ